MRYKKCFAFLILLIIAIASCFYFRCYKTDQSPEKEIAQVDSSLMAFRYGICVDSLDICDYVIKEGDNLASIYAGLGFSSAQAAGICQASACILDPTKLKAGMEYFAIYERNTKGNPLYVVISKSLTDYVVIDLKDSVARAYPFAKQITLRRKYVEGTINSSLWNVMKENGGNPLLALKLENLYAWQIDFYDVKDGDSFRMLYDEAYVDDTTTLNATSVRGAIFTHQGKEFVAIPFTQDSVFEYFDLEGNSLRKAFLKAPLDFFRITSRFTNARFHPVLKRYRAHHGVDYAAPVGTPVKSIGAGIVVAKGYQGNGGGNFLKIKHNSVYTTSYMHLSRFAKGIGVGSHVQQGQEIAYVGSTGLSTGPHLDFRVYKNGQPTNPLTMEAPPSLPVKPELVDSFIVVKKQVLAELDSFKIDKIK